jgi:hypothetical protein
MENNIKMDLKAIGWGGINWIALAPERYRLRGERIDCECGNDPSGSIKCGQFLD